MIAHMHKHFVRITIMLMYIAGIVSCGSETETQSMPKKAQTEYPEFEAANLQRGRKVWMGTCKGCHALGVAGAPKAGDEKAWEARVKQGRQILYQHAIEGFFGPEYTQMPSRGGNASLSDKDVMAAVDYMLALVNAFD